MPLLGKKWTIEDINGIVTICYGNDKGKHKDNQMKIYWIINILTKLLLMTKMMEITVTGNICIHVYCIYT